MKSFTDIEQSKKLAEILPIESADMCYRLVAYNPDNTHEYAPYCFKGTLSSDIPCWSLAALINALPISIKFKDDEYYLRFMKEYVEYANDEISLTGRCLHTTGNNNLVDACYEIILKLHELNLI